jgi:hypothetical protein
MELNGIDAVFLTKFVEFPFLPMNRFFGVADRQHSFSLHGSVLCGG